MTRKKNIINNIICLGITLILVGIVTAVSNKRFYSYSMIKVMALFIVGAIVSGFICTACHEIGHIISGKKNGFAFISTSIWFFKWQVVKNKIRFSFTMIGDAGGYTENIPKSTEDLSKRLYNVTLSGSLAVILPTLIGIVPLFISSLPLWAFCFMAMFLPIGAYCFLNNILPMTNSGVENDGALLSCLKKDNDTGKVVLAINSIESYLYNGKTPAEIDEKLYFDVPQLPEDDLNFIMLLNLRHDYYLDKGDFIGVKQTLDRLISLEDYIPKPFFMEIKTKALYYFTIIDLKEDKADDLMFELDKYLNKNNSALSVRAKLGYILFVVKDNERFDMFYKKGIREANRCPVKGYGLFEKKLFNNLK